MLKSSEITLQLITTLTTFNNVRRKCQILNTNKMTVIIIISTTNYQHRGLRKRGRKVAIFRQTDCNFRQRRLRVLTISILHLNPPKMGTFSPRFCIFERNFLTRIKFSDRLKFRRGGKLPPATATNNITQHATRPILTILFYSRCYRQTDAKTCNTCCKQTKISNFVQECTVPVLL